MRASWLQRAGRGLLVAGILVFTLFPFYWAIVSSLETGSDLFRVDFWPRRAVWSKNVSPAPPRAGPPLPQMRESAGAAKVGMRTSYYCPREQPRRV